MATKVNEGTSTSSPGSDPDQQQAEMEGGGAAGQGHGVADTDPGGQLPLEGVESGPAGAIQLESKASSSIRRSSGPTSGGER